MPQGQRLPPGLYVAATPIGNLADASPRLAEILAAVDVVAAEDTRRTAVLLRHLGLRTPTLSLHEHNERRVTARLLERLRGGARVALVSDAGTPLVSDPGRHLVAACHREGILVSPVPGPSAVVAALSVSGLPAERFCFEGFLPARPAERRRRLEALRAEPRTLVFLEAPHRLLEGVRDAASVLGARREAVLARELTKLHETVRRDSLGALAAWLEAHPEQCRGEAVLVVSGAGRGKALGGKAAGGEAARGKAVAGDAVGEAAARRTLALLLEELPPARAAALAARLTGWPRNRLYRWAVERGGGR